MQIYINAGGKHILATFELGVWTSVNMIMHNHIHIVVISALIWFIWCYNDSVLSFMYLTLTYSSRIII